MYKINKQLTGVFWKACRTLAGDLPPSKTILFAKKDRVIENVLCKEIKLYYKGKKLVSAKPFFSSIELEITLPLREAAKAEVSLVNAFVKDRFGESFCTIKGESFVKSYNGGYIPCLPTVYYYL